MKINGCISTVMLTALLLIATLGGITHAQDEEDWMPDPNLRYAISEKLEIETLTITDMQRLHRFAADGKFKADLREIQSLKGLEHAINLKFLAINFTKVSDITPLAGLENLRGLGLGYNRITDITPLAGLIHLQELNLQHNQISDTSPLKGLVNLKVLDLAGNQIVDFTPIYGLTGIETLRLGLARSGISLDSEVLQRLNPVDGPVVCEIARPSIHARLENITYPSVFQACGDIVNLPELSWEERIAYHDLFFCGQTFGWVWMPTPGGKLRLIGDPEVSSIAADRIRARNPNILLLSSINYYVVGLDEFPDDWPYFVRDAEGKRFKFQEWDQYVIDFTHPAVQEMIIQKAAEIARCGIFDGTQLDHWGKGGIGPITDEEAWEAKDRIIQGIRDAVGDDFLIQVTTSNRTIPPRHAAYINGLFMETTEDYEGGYTYAGLANIENTLLWGEENLREPQVNCLAGRGVRSEPLDSPRNLQWMRLWTAMSLTHSDGYVLFTMGGALDHPPHTFEFLPGHADLHVQGIRHSHQNKKYWYSFWDADLGRPVGGDETKAQLYKTPKGISIDGLFIREFTNGWAVYNRSGKERKIYFSEKVSGVASSVVNKHWHTIPDLDGEIFLKQATPTTEPSIGTQNRYDVDNDGDVDVSDVRLVVLALGQNDKNITNPRTDINKDNKVDKNDVLLVIDNLDDANGAPLNTDLLSPISEETMQLLNPTILRSTLEALYLENDGSLKYQQAIVYLEHLLAAIRPDATQLLANYPNPFNPETWIPYHLANPSNVQITIYDTRGIVIRQLDLGHQPEGYYTSRSRAAYWDGRNDVGEHVASGVYFYQLQAEDLSYLRKMVIVK